MEILRDSVVFVLLLWYFVVVVHSSTHIWNSRAADSEHKWYDIYYEVFTRKKIPIVQRIGDRQEETSTTRFGRIPCSCQNLMCGCCAQFNVRLFDYNKKGCMNFTYDPFEFAVKGNMFMDNESMYEYKISAKNPPPACLQVPMPYVPSMDVCLKMFDIYTPGRNLHACVNFLTRIEHAEVLVLEFDCFLIGSDGVSVQKYNATSSPSSGADVTAAVTDASDVTTSLADAIDVTPKITTTADPLVTGSESDDTSNTENAPNTNDDIEQQ